MLSQLPVQVWFWTAKGIGLKTYRRISHWLKQQRLSWTDWWSGGPPVWQASGVTQLQLAALISQKALVPEALVESMRQEKIWIISETDAIYPTALLQTPDHPPLLFGQGNLDLLAGQRTIAVIGTRHMTAYGQLVTSRLVEELVQAGVTIISGFMYGVDTAAHLACQTAGGQSIGVLGYGLQHQYPTSHWRLRATLLEAGHAFITEYPPSTRPTAGTFVQRNRLIAGLAQAIVVTEAGIKSGSHITAKFGLEYGRLIAAVPGPITNHYSQGTKWLVNQGACLVTSAADILNELNWPAEVAPLSVCQTSQSEIDSLAARVIQELATINQSTSQLQIRCQVPLEKLLSTLTTLELQQRVQLRSGRWWLC